MIDRRCMLIILCAILCGQAGCRETSPPPRPATQPAAGAPQEHVAATAPAPATPQQDSLSELVQTVLVEQVPSYSKKGLVCQEQAARYAEDVTVHFDARVNRIRWYGSLKSSRYAYQSHSGLRFRLRAYHGDGSVPSGEPFYEADLFSPGRGGAGRRLEFEAELPTPLKIRAGRKLWISISCLDSSRNWTWNWAPSRQAGDLRPARKSGDGPWQTGPIKNRRAFTLEGLRPVPTETDDVPPLP